jgi:hypothetical protein
MRSALFVVCALGLVVVAHSITAVSAASPIACAATTTLVTFSGDVRHGETFEQPFGSALIFKLAPSADPAFPGWMIEVRARGDNDPEHELSWIVTPPYRSWTPRYLDTSYGHTAASTAAITPREFQFMLDPREWERAMNAVRLLLWPTNTSEAELDAARATVDSIAIGRGVFDIREARLGRAADGSERIEFLRFAVELCAR